MKQGFNFLEFPTLASTNSYAKVLLKMGQIDDITCISTPHQTAGRGTRSRKWVSPIGTGWTFSLVFPSIQYDPNVTLQVAAVLTSTLKQLYGIPAYVKPINDIMLNGGKLAGILTESLPLQGEKPAIHPKQSYWVSLIIGIGLNVATADRHISPSQPNQSPVSPIALQDAMLPDDYKTVALASFLKVFVPALASVIQA
jgi:BirA family transcriptional regulator, biotin operon repressor / biotin---[acetyl-CoA-carboxylase] ligase